MPSDTAQLANLTPQERRALLADMLAKKEQGLKIATLSFAQERFWLLEQINPGGIASIILPVRLTGNLDTTALTRSLDEIVRRHETLRTTFTTVGGQPVQVITPPSPAYLIVKDLEALSPVEQSAEIRRLARMESTYPFDLTRGPLFRTTLLRLGTTEHILILNTHHFVSDGWSASIFIREVTALYRAFTSGQASPLPPLPFHYADYVHWQRERLKGEFLEQQLAYWKGQLGESRNHLEFPKDRPYPPTSTWHGAHEGFTMSSALTQRLKTLARQEGVTLFMLLLAGFQALLYRYTGQSDIRVATLVANRNLGESEKLIGLLLNTLVLRANLQARLTFRELLRQVHQTTLGAYAHQDLPFEKVLEALQAPRQLGHGAVFQTMLVLQNMPSPRVELPNLTLQGIQIQEDFPINLELALFLTEQPEGLMGYAEYPTELFEAATIHRMLAHFQILLAGAVANPDRPIAELPLLSAAEQQQILKEWNHTQAEFPAERCIPELFEEQVDRTPDAVAVVFEQHHLTYRELNRRANQLAQYLRQRGVGPETFVGLCLERSPEMIVGLLGILKAGGAYVPLDPTYPPQRLAAILLDTQVRLLISQAALAPILPAIESPVLLIDRDWETVAQADSGNPVRAAEPPNLAYVIYTSGSTGQPKGVMIPQRALVQYATAAVQHFDLTPHDGVLQFASISFDAAAEEIYPCLLSGAKLILRTERMLDSMETFLQICAAQGVTVLDLPTAYWHTLVAQNGVTSSDWPVSVRLIILGGEAARADRVTTWFEQAPQHVRLINTYGPTETTIVATQCDLIPDVAEKVPIGKPVANTQVYILDPHLHPVPIGVPGELYIGGADLARGYLHRPELTAAVFRPDPFGEVPGACLYKTGDLVRYLPDGRLQFLGRVDHQVKVRGFRIELGEIEARLNQHPAIQQSAVILREEVDGDKRLVAYLVTPDNHQILASELRPFLQETLPDYMIPAAFVSLDALPLTPSGKVDRRALPAPEADGGQEEYAPPETSMEERLVEIWSQVLNVGPISIHANFFDLGGHSLLATQVVYRINEALQTKLAVRDLFLEPTVARLGLLIEERLIEELEREEIA